MRALATLALLAGCASAPIGVTPISATEQTAVAVPAAAKSDVNAPARFSPSVQCDDRTFSEAEGQRGACSHHDGIRR